MNVPFRPDDILAACAQSFDEGDNKCNCSGFVKAVASRLGITLTGQADDIVRSIDKGWASIPTGRDAYEKAKAGCLVLAGLKSADHIPPRHNGHIAVVAPRVSPETHKRLGGDLYHGKYPVIWGGSLGGQYWSRGDKTVGEVWSRVDRDHVLYRYFGG